MDCLNGKIPVGVLGATGMVGQKFVELLENHPWFSLVAVAASDRSQGKSYGAATQWKMAVPLKPEIAQLIVESCHPNLPCQVVFSGLDSSVAGDIETSFAKAGYCVISNSQSHRLDPDTPLLIPEVNGEHLDLISSQPYAPGMIVTNPNCAVIGLTTALKPLDALWGIEKVHIVTLQALSGAGYPGVPSLDTFDNVIPFIAGEEEKLESEPLKILGTLTQGRLTSHPMRLSAQCNRVCVTDGHLACVSVQLQKKTTSSEIIQAWQNFSAEPQALKLPTAPLRPIVYHPENHAPQPKFHRHLDKAMTVSIGRLRPCPLLEWKFVLLSHNTVRGAAGCALLNAELLLAKKLIKY